MEPIRFDGPSLDYGVVRRLRRLDRQLRVTWSPYALNPETGLPIIARPGFDPTTGQRVGGEVKDPAFYLWRKDNHSSHHFFIRTYDTFGHFQALCLEADLARFHRPEDLGRLLRDRYDEKRLREAGYKSSYLSDKAMANKQMAYDIANKAREVKARREAKGFSYAGQTTRTSGGEGQLIELTDREMGLES